MTAITFLQLPLDVQLNILRRLSLSDLRNVMTTCTVLRDFVIKENALWRPYFRHNLIINNASDNRKLLSFSLYNQCRISLNWCRGIYRDKIILQHQTNYMPWLKFHNSQAMVLSVGPELRAYSTDKRGLPHCQDICWKLDVPIVMREDVRTNDISRFVVKENVIVCGNRDGCVAVYNVDNILRRPTLLAHIRDCHKDGHVEVSAVDTIASGSLIITGSSNSPEIKIWQFDYDPGDIYVGNRSKNMETGISTAIKDFQLPNISGTRCLAVNSKEDKLAVGPNGNSKPLLLDIETGSLLLSTKKLHPKLAVRDLRWHNDNTITYVTHSGDLQSVDIRSGEVVYNAMDPFQSTLYCVKTDGVNSVVVGSAEYSRCVLFDTRTDVHVQMYFTQKKSSPIYCLDFDSTKLMAAADRSVACLNFNINMRTGVLRDYSKPFELINR